jgi:hypothetical protein
MERIFTDEKMERGFHGRKIKMITVGTPGLGVPTGIIPKKISRL